MNVLVVGGTGFLGSHLVNRLLELGHTVRVFDRCPEQHRSPLAHVDYRIAQLDDPFSVAEALADIDIVYHLASATVPSISNRDPIGDVKGNLIATLVLLDQMVHAKVQRIIYLSSGGTVYGNPLTLPISEDHQLKPICSYGVVKVAIENYLFMYHQLYGVNSVVLRPSNLYGPHQRHVGVQGFISTFLSKLKKGEPLHVWGDGSVVRDFLYVTDLVDLCISAGISNVCGVFNAGSGRGYSISQVADLIANITGATPVIHYDLARSFDVREVVLDISKSKQIFGWSPKVSLECGIRNQWQWLQDT